jgi:hypothetical protein
MSAAETENAPALNALRNYTEHWARERASLLSQLAAVEENLHLRMRQYREAGATQLEVLKASGYASMDAVRKILDPAVKTAAAQTRAARRRQTLEPKRATRTGS